MQSNGSARSIIARSIVEAHGGSLEVESAPKEGAVFTLELPVEPSV